MGPQTCWWFPGHFWGPGGMIFGSIFWLLVIAGIIYLIIKYVKKSDVEPKNETALDILKKRYAKGEIDAEEFARKKKDLES
mgnify:FL=1